MEISRLSQPFELKFAGTEAKAGTFSGYGSIFGNVDSYGDVIEKGAFKTTLAEWQAKGKYPPMLLQHGDMFAGGDMLPIGKWTHMEEDGKGLKVSGQLLGLETERGKYLHEVLKEGAIDGLSIGYRAKKFTLGTKPEEPRRKLEAVDLVELSVVTFPANDKSRLGGVKSERIDAVTSLSDAEDLLREAAGLSKKDARDLVSRITRISRREAVDDQNLKSVLDHIRSARALIPTT